MSTVNSHFSPLKMNGEVVLWSVVQFPNGGTAVVLEHWFNAQEQTLLWPPKHIKLTKALRDGMQPDDKWITYKDVRVLTTCETHDEAKKRETKYTSTMCPTSEIESEDEGDLRQKRRSRPIQQHVPSDSDDHSSGDAKRKRFAKPPDVGFPGQTPKSSQSRKALKSSKAPAVRPLGQEPTMNDSLDGGMIYSYLEELQTPDPNNNLVTSNYRQSLTAEVHNAEMPGFATAQYQQLQSPQQHVQQLQSPQLHFQQLQDPQSTSTSSGMLGYSSGQYNSPPGLPQRAQNGMSGYSSGQYNTPPGVTQRRQHDFRGNNVHQYDPMHSVPNHGCNDRTTQMAGDDGQLMKDLAIQKMTSMLAEVLVVVKDLSRDVHFIKNELAEGIMTPGGTRGHQAATTTPMLPFQLPIDSEHDFNVAESLLMEQSVRQKMISRLAMVGGSSENLIRLMLKTAMTNALASGFNWAGKKDKRSESKKPFKHTTLQECIFAAARQFDPKLTEKDYSETVKKWLRYAPYREGGTKSDPNPSQANQSQT